MKNVMLSLKKEVSKQIIAGDSTVLSDLQTLNGMGVGGGPIDTTGWFEEAAFGAQNANTVGTLSKLTYQAQNWQNQVVAAGGTLALSHLDTLFIQCAQYHPSGKFPDILLMSPNMFAAFQALQQSSVRYISEGDRVGLDRDMVVAGAGRASLLIPTWASRTAPARRSVATPCPVTCSSSTPTWMASSRWVTSSPCRAPRPSAPRSSTACSS